MDALSYIGGAVSLECAILLMATTMLLDYWDARRGRRLWHSAKNVLEDVSLPELTPEARPQAA
jgi:hypothetical protein